MVVQTSLERYGLWIGSDEVHTERTFQPVSPVDEQPTAIVASADPAHVEAAVEAAWKAFSQGPWASITASERARLIFRLADILERDAEKLADLECKDNGKLRREVRAQWRYIPSFFRYFAGLADKTQGQVPHSDRSNFFIYNRREPLGVVAAITPWNSPGLLLTFKLAPGLAAGCTFVVKPSEFTPVSTLALARCFEEAGFPPGVYNVVTGGGEVGAALVEHPRVAKVAFTGATETGKRIAASAAGHLARVSLELGGKSPTIVFPDADLDLVVNGVVAGIFAATGQSCMAGSRLLVHESLHDEVVQRLIGVARGIRIGDPADPDTEMGPVANKPQMEKVLHYIDVAKQEGATLAFGGERHPTLGGCFVQPTIFTDVNNAMRIAQEEVFGPVLSVIKFKDEEEAIRIANDTRFGLAAAVWTRNIHRAHRVAHRLRAGTVWINAYRVVSYTTGFGGMGESGLGRENGIDAILEYTESKSVYVELTGEGRDPFVQG